jgi:chromosome segregation ATPase|tara:strand:- start:94 stop:345 length:252 start_codon:yes stop_codon:yes gene_type:complete
MSELEKESLEAHVDMCSERYNGLHRELKNLSSRMDKFERMLTEMRDMMMKMKTDRQSQLISWGIGIIGTLVAAVGALLFLLLG